MAKPFGRSLSDFGPTFSLAEQALLKNCRFGIRTQVASCRPKQRQLPNVVRGALIRFLALGGDDLAPVHETGLEIDGAWIDGELDLEGVSVATRITLQHCHFEREVVLRLAMLNSALDLTGSYVPSIRGDGLTCRGDLFLRHGFEAQGRVRLIGATIFGDADFEGAILRGGLDGALYLSGAEVRGSVYFRTGFQAFGAVHLVGANIAHDVDCDNAVFSAAWKKGVQQEGLILRRAVINGELAFRETKVSNAVFADAKVALLRDEAETWDKSITLNGFEYKAIADGSPMGAQMRCAWLRMQSQEHIGTRSNFDKFCPQPWHQLMRVLRAAGHNEDAIEVGMEYERHLRSIGKIGARGKKATWYRQIERATLSALHSVFGIVAGYGYRPIRVIYWMLGAWVFCALLYWCAARDGVMGPSNPLIFEDKKYAACSSTGGTPKSNWTNCLELKSEYSTFSPFAFSLDVLLPVVNLRQEDSWGPLVPEPKLSTISGAFVRSVIWIQNLFGWVCSLLLVATVSGFARRAE